MDRETAWLYIVLIPFIALIQVSLECHTGQAAHILPTLTVSPLLAPQVLLNIIISIKQHVKINISHKTGDKMTCFKCIEAASPYVKYGSFHPTGVESTSTFWMKTLLDARSRPGKLTFKLTQTWDCKWWWVWTFDPLVLRLPTVDFRLTLDLIRIYLWLAKIISTLGGKTNSMKIIVIFQ